jgi:hypothetical protein
MRGQPLGKCECGGGVEAHQGASKEMDSDMGGETGGGESDKMDEMQN